MTQEETHPSDRLSVLGNLRGRHDQIKATLTKAIRVPRWEDPEVWVTYRPVDHGVIRAGQRRTENASKKTRDEAEVTANIDVLIAGCVNVYAVLDGQKYSLLPGHPEGELTGFDTDLAANLGLGDGATAREVVKALFYTDGDILQHAQQVADFSGYRMAEAEDDLQGE